MSSKMLHDLAPISTTSCPSILSPTTRFLGFLGAVTTFFLSLEHTMITSAKSHCTCCSCHKKHSFSDFHTDGSFFPHDVAQMSPPQRGLLISLLHLLLQPSLLLLLPAVSYLLTMPCQFQNLKAPSTTLPRVPRRCLINLLNE